MYYIGMNLKARRAYSAEKKRHQRRSLTYGYVRDILHKETGIPRAEIPFNLIILKQATLSLKRKVGKYGVSKT